MAAKLVLFLIILALIVAVAIIAAFYYFTRKEELEHEKELREMEQTEKLFEEE